MAKRADGRGAIYHRSDGRWEAQFRLEDGRRKCLYATSRREVLRQLKETRWQLDHGVPVSAHKMSLGVYLHDWLEVTTARVRPSTIQNYELNVRRLCEQIGEVPLIRLSPDVIQAVYRRQLRSGLTPYSVLQTHRVLHRALHQATHWGLITKNPAALALPPRPRRREMTALSPDELGRLFDHTRHDRLYPLWAVLGTAGLRIGEALGLSWADVDLVAGKARIRRALQRRRGAGFIFLATKTPRSRRTVLLTKLAIEALREQRARQNRCRRVQPDWEESGLVFTNMRGGPMEAAVARRALARVTLGAGLPNIRVHDLRHTTATVLLVAGVHPKVVQDLFGHHTITTTMDTYSHVIPAMHEDAVRKLDAVLGLAEGPTQPPTV
jgi:integrase